MMNASTEPKLNGDQEFDEYFNKLSIWKNRFCSYERDAASAFAQSLHNFSLPFGRLYAPGANIIGDIYECQVAPLWKRFCAEGIDHLILTVIQLYIINILHYGFDLSFMDYENFLRLTSFSAQLVIIEIVSRIMLFLYESYFLSINGATPGKKILGLKVVQVELVAEMPGGNTILATPCRWPSWWLAFFRSILKNVGILLFPICYGIMLIGFARSGYDFITKTIVIDTSRVPMRLLSTVERADAILRLNAGIRL